MEREHGDDACGAICFVFGSFRFSDTSRRDTCRQQVQRSWVKGGFLKSWAPRYLFDLNRVLAVRNYSQRRLLRVALTKRLSMAIKPQ